jgi:hypothetical protein
VEESRGEDSSGDAEECVDVERCRSTGIGFGSGEQRRAVQSSGYSGGQKKAEESTGIDFNACRGLLHILVYSGFPLACVANFCPRQSVR